MSHEVSTAHTDRCLIDGSTGLKQRLKATAIALNCVIAVVVLGGYMVVENFWSMKGLLLAVTAVAMANPVLAFVMIGLQGFFNRNLYRILDKHSHSPISPAELDSARRALLTIPWRSSVETLIIWTVLVPPALYLVLHTFGEGTQSLAELLLAVLSVLPLLVLSVLLGFELSCRPYVSFLFPRGGLERFQSPFNITVRKRLFVSFFLIGPYSAGLLALLVYERVAASTSIADALKHLVTLETFLVAISLSILTVLAYYVEKSIDRPLTQLQKALSDIHKGHLDTRIPVQSLDDWGLMADRFNEMAAGLQEKAALSKENAELLTQLSRRAADLEDLVRLYKEASQQARTDALSGLYNRRAFEEHLRQHFVEYERYRVPFSLVMIDIDHFKKFNDTYGHPVGDHVINSVSKTIKNTLRLADIPARWGGEEFIVCLPHMDLQGGIIVAERMRNEIEQMKLIDDEGNDLPRITVSLGVATSRSTDQTAESIIERADHALYAAKDKGRNQTQSIEPEFVAITG